MNEKKRFNVEQHTTLDNRIIDVFPVSHQYIHKLENELKYNPDNEITLQDDKGNKFVLIQTERIDMQVKLNETINKLQQENQQLKEENEKLKLQNFNLREDIMIQKKSLPNKEIKDKTFFDLYDMPTYEQLKYRIDKALFELRKYKLVRNNDDLVSLSAMYEFIIDNSIEILKGDNND